MPDFLPFNVITVPLERGVNLIEASAGTGKTYSIAALFLRFILEEQLPLPKILAVTFTDAATRELRDRIRKRLRDAFIHLGCEDQNDPVIAEFLSSNPSPDRKAKALRDLDLAVQSFDEAQIFTIHSFCQRMLKDHAFESGIRYEAETLSNTQSLFLETASDFWRRQFYHTSPFLAALVLSKHSTANTPSALVGLLGKTQSHPGLAILPAADPTPLFDLRAEMEESFRKLAATWAEERETILPLLTQPKTFAAAFGRKLAENLPLLDSFTEETVHPGGLSLLLDLTPEALQKQLLKKAVFPEHAFWEESARFCRWAERYFSQLRWEFLSYAKRELRERKQRRNQLSFDDQITRLRDALEEEKGGLLKHELSRKYTAVLIDEFQDTDPNQAAIFQHLFGQGNHWLYYIGDPKQAIYAFRGADIFAYLQAAQSANRHYSLSTNWRSDPDLLAGFNLLFQQTPQPFIYEAIRYIPVDAAPDKKPSPSAPLEFHFLKEPAKSKDTASYRVVDLLAQQIAAQLCDPTVRGRDIAVLVRTHLQAAMVQQALQKLGLRSLLHTDANVFHSEEATMLQALLDAVIEPRREGLVRRALASRIIGLNAEEIETINSDEAARIGWIERFTEWHSIWSKRGFMAMFRHLMATENLRERWVQSPLGERRLTNFLHLSELLHQEATARNLSMGASADWLRDQRHTDSHAAEAAQLRLESDGDAISIVTIHKSKGLEYPIVYLPFLWQDSVRSKDAPLFHDAKGVFTLDLRPSGEEVTRNREHHVREALAEQMRLLYVALTRAKHRCILYLGDYPGLAQSPLANLFPLESRENLRAALEDLAIRNPRSIQFHLEAGHPYSIPDKEQERSTELVNRPFEGSLSKPTFLTSFTSLATSAHSQTTPATPLGEVVDPALTSDEVVVPAPPSLEEPIETALTIAHFAKGAHAGDFFHDVMESLDFQKPDELSRLVPEKLALYGFSDSPFQTVIEKKLREVLEVELQPGLRLGLIALKDRLTEVSFSASLPHLTPEGLKQAYRYYDGSFRPDALQFQTISGFLRGAIDLLFCHEGKYYLLDWKSNHLGNRPEDYTAEAVEEAMLEHLYPLQAHLYVLAIHRFLRSRIKDYDYETHFGGYFYLFLRGIDPAKPEQAIYREKPSPRFVEALDQL